MTATSAHTPPAGTVEPPRTIELGRPANRLVTYGLYPALALAAAVATTTAIAIAGDRGAVTAVYGLAVIAVLAVVEWRFPLRAGWRMTRHTFFRRDAPFLVTGFVVDRAVEALAVVAVTRLAPEGGAGPLAGMPVVAQAVVALIGYDLVWYHYHRLAHRGGRLWRLHGAHHAPSQLYLFMHGVFHPLDLAVARVLFAAVLFVSIGVSTDAAFVALVVLGLQATVSHLNVDLRLGPLNRVLTGPETHRYHHSAGFAGNYGSVTTLWDQAFGTFVYDPAQAPERLGLIDPGSYPDPERYVQVLLWPVRGRAAVPARATSPTVRR